MSAYSQIGNLLFNPFAADEDLPQTGVDSIDGPGFGNTVLRAGGLAAGYGSAAYLIRKLALMAARKKHAKRDEKLISYSSAAHDPVSLLEQKEGGLLPEWTVPYEWGQRPVYELAAKLSAVVGGAAAGAKLAGVLESRYRKQQLAERQRKAEEEMDDILRSRTTQEKEAFVVTGSTLAGLIAAGAGVIGTKYSKLYDPNRPSYEQQAARSKVTHATWTPANKVKSYDTTDAMPDAQERLKRQVMSLYLPIALGIGVPSYFMAKRYFDANDPARNRMKRLENVAKRKALMRQAPVLLDKEDIASGADETEDRRKSAAGKRVSLSTVLSDGVREAEQNALS